MNDDNNWLVTQAPENSDVSRGLCLLCDKKGGDDMQHVNVLGVMYKIKETDKVEDPALEECDGYCDDTVKMCVIDSMNSNDALSKKNMTAYKQKVIRHELIHAFLSESGLAENSWASNEEVVDWIAAQFPKMLVAFNAANVI